ncbi:MAG: peptidoglycan-binding domain-containing protein [Sedimentisphaerales bacterium]|jgi:hypothetical protein
MAKHIVKQGDCMESIAYKHGFFWETLWNLAENAELKRKREDPNVLLAGDQVFIPDKCEKTEDGATEQRHRFRRKGVPSKIHLVFEKDGEPVANVPYILDIDGNIFSKETNDRGEIIHPIPPNAKKGKLTLGEGDDAEEYELHLGHINPLDEISGVQARLNNLGFDCGRADGKMSPKTIEALKAFQDKVGLPATGEVDQATRQALEKEHMS